MKKLLLALCLIPSLAVADNTPPSLPGYGSSAESAARTNALNSIAEVNRQEAFRLKLENEYGPRQPRTLPSLPGYNSAPSQPIQTYPNYNAGQSATAGFTNGFILGMQQQQPRK